MPKFTRPYPAGYNDLPSETTPISASTLDDKDDFLEGIGQIEIQTFTALSQIGLTDGDLTINDELTSFNIILSAMPLGSTLRLAVVGTNFQTLFPGIRGMVEFKRSTGDSGETIKFSSRNGQPNQAVYEGQFYLAANTWSGWKLSSGSINQVINIIPGASLVIPELAYANAVICWTSTGTRPVLSIGRQQIGVFGETEAGGTRLIITWVAPTTLINGGASSGNIERITMI